MIQFGPQLLSSSVLFLSLLVLRVSLGPGFVTARRKLVGSGILTETTSYWTSNRWISELKFSRSSFLALLRAACSPLSSCIHPLRPLSVSRLCWPLSSYQAPILPPLPPTPSTPGPRRPPTPTLAVCSSMKLKRSKLLFNHSLFGQSAAMTETVRRRLAVLHVCAVPLFTACAIVCVCVILDLMRQKTGRMA